MYDTISLLNYKNTWVQIEGLTYKRLNACK